MRTFLNSLSQSSGLGLPLGGARSARSGGAWGVGSAFALAACVAGSSLLTGCAVPPQVSVDALPLRRVVVYRNGVAYYERSGRVTAPEVRFRMRTEMVGDFLATLAIVERGGSTVRSASFPIELAEDKEPELPPDLQLLLKPGPEKKKKGFDLKEVILSLDGKEHDLAVGYVAATPVWRPTYRLVVREDGSADLQSWGIVQNLSGEDWTNVKLALVAGAPIAFESTLGTPVLPGRPVVTDQGEIIAAVPKGLTSTREVEGAAAVAGGEYERAPATEDLDEADKEEAKKAERRPSAPAKPSLSGGIGHGPGTGTGQGFGTGYSRIGGRRVASNRKGGPSNPYGGAMPAPEPVAPMAPPPSLSGPRDLASLAAVAVQGGATRYELPHPVTVPNKSATMVLLQNERVPGEAVFLFAPDGGVADSARHPFRVARYRNATKGLLEQGPIAVFESGSFLGQGLVSSLPPGAMATVPFALERSLAVELDHNSKTVGSHLSRIELGRIYVRRDDVRDTIYKVKNGDDKAAKLLVKHARDGAYRLFHPPKGTEDNSAEGNALVPIQVPAHGRAELHVDERRLYTVEAGFESEMADAAVREFLADQRADQQQVGKLKAAWEARDKYVKLTREAAALGREQGELDASARQTRLSLQSIEKNTQAADLRTKLTARLKEISSRQEVVSKRLIELEMNQNEQRVRFEELLRAVKLEVTFSPKD